MFFNQLSVNSKTCTFRKTVPWENPVWCRARCGCLPLTTDVSLARQKPVLAPALRWRLPHTPAVLSPISSSPTAGTPAASRRPGHASDRPQSGFLDMASGMAEVGARGRDCCLTLVWHPRSASQSRCACPRSPPPVSRLCFGSQLDTGIQTRVAFVIYSPVFSFHRA